MESKYLRPEFLGQGSTGPVRLLKLPDVLILRAESRSTWLRRVKDGTAPPIVRTGTRAVAWIAAEVDAVTRASIAGATDDDLRALVCRLVQMRTEAVDRLAA